jgi:hypothetical protein
MFMGGRIGDSRKQLSIKSEIPLRIATSAPHVLLKHNVIPNPALRDEGSPSPIPVLSKTDLQRTFLKFYILCDLLNVVDSNHIIVSDTSKY